MSDPSSATRFAETLNRQCACRLVDPAALAAELARQTDEPDFYRALHETHPHLYASTAVFVSRAQARAMEDVIDAVERVVAMPEYRAAAAAYAPAAAGPELGARGVFFGYDFHLDANGPKLIEINTNAGGGFLNAVLARTHRACCPEVEPLLDEHAGPPIEQVLFDMFRAEWRLSRGAAVLRRVAIVDDAPREQYLYPEFLLCRRMFRDHGIDALIADPRELRFDGAALVHQAGAIDLIYNRLTDFALADPAHAALRAAHSAGTVVLTPHPRAHALYADKRNLAILTDAERLAAWNVPADRIATLAAGIAKTTVVAAGAADMLWANRKRLFFKPAAGYGSKAAYRGDKLTRRTFGEIVRHPYVAQELVAPSERQVPDEAGALKLDVRNYVYAGRVQLRAARLYRGQTTNFRTPGGGFAPVFVIPDTAALPPPTR